MAGIRKRGPFWKPLGEDARLRFGFTRSKKEILRFMVQLEAKTGKGWTAIVRFDTSHGGAHKHEYKTDGDERKRVLDTTYHEDLGYSVAMTSAEQDIKQHWEEYCEKYWEGEWPA